MALTSTASRSTQILTPLVPTACNRRTPPIPNSPILDSFIRANENPLSDGGKWTSDTVSATFPMLLVSNSASGSVDGTFCQSHWNNATFGPNCEMYYTVGTLPGTAANYIRLYVRVTGVNSGTESGYMVQWSNDANGCRMFREVNTALTLIGQNAGAQMVAGDVVTLRAVGSAITLYRNGVSVVAATDATLNSAGNLVIGSKDGAVRLQNFGGGTLA